MAGGNHRVITAWGFLALRLPEKDAEWMGYRVSILKGLGVLDKDGKPTDRLEIVKAANMVRLTEESFQASFHFMPDYTTWYGLAKLKKTIVEMREIDKHMRMAHKHKAMVK